MASEAGLRLPSDQSSPDRSRCLEELEDVLIELRSELLDIQGLRRGHAGVSRVIALTEQSVEFLINLQIVSEQFHSDNKYDSVRDPLEVRRGFDREVTLNDRERMGLFRLRRRQRGIESGESLCLNGTVNPGDTGRP